MSPEQTTRLWREIEALIDAEADQFEPKPLVPSTAYLPRSHRGISGLGAAFLATVAVTTVLAYAALVKVTIDYARSLGAF